MQTQRDFEELTPQQAEGLRDFLVQLLIKYGPGPRTVRIQLCVAIAAMAVHVPSAQFGNGGVIGWLFARLQQDSRPETAVVCMLELLVTLPQVRHRMALCTFLQAATAPWRSTMPHTSTHARTIAAPLLGFAGVAPRTRRPRRAPRAGGGQQPRRCAARAAALR